MRPLLFQVIVASLLAVAAGADDPGAAERSASMARDAAAALRAGHYPAAHGLASQAIALNAENAQALNLRAIASIRMRRFGDAVADANVALALVPGNVPALQTRSLAFAKQGDYRASLKDVSETLARDPSNPYAYQNKALALAGMKDRAGALEALRRSAALDSRFQNLLERALRLPPEQDLIILFDDETTVQTVAGSPSRTIGRLARMALLSLMGGILIALAILHIVSASWREKMHTTVRRVLAPSGALKRAFLRGR